MCSSTANSYGLVVNSFEELEPVFLDYWNRENKPRAWCIGPLCLIDQPEPLADHEETTWIRWLDQKLEGVSVLYVAFGSQAEISAQQLEEIGMGLEKSETHFLWVVKKKESQG
ncbi:hypothetical protein SAY87_023033 [Trapa incisa]|uniref:Uncharacterized protein n=1 Tax=Trapa incisa TaxID=236973 RepID=A0AAN7Q5H0_9MYRT|nr:hypothetical protein SAY87_023033 [Trapa incisa]